MYSICRSRNGAYWKQSRVHKLETIICAKLLFATFAHTKTCIISYNEMAGIFPKHDPHSYWVTYQNPDSKQLRSFLGTARCRNTWNSSHRINAFLTNASNSLFFILWTESSLVQKWFCIFNDFIARCCIFDLTWKITTVLNKLDGTSAKAII